MGKLASASIVVGTVVVMVASLSVAHAGRFSWFEEPYPGDRLWLDSTAAHPLTNTLAVGFGETVFRSFASSRGLDVDDAYTPANEPQFESNAFYVYGEFEPDRVIDRTLLPGYRVDTSSQPQRLNVLAAKWQHRLDEIHSVSLAASYAENPSPIQSTQDILDTRAVLSWTSKWGEGIRPGVTGSVFVGDESARDAAYRQLGHKYFGFSIGGELSLFRDHTQYLSYRAQRYLSSVSDDLLYTPGRMEEGSLLAAGWRWQVQRNWSVHAEASFGLNGASLDPFNLEHNRVIFGTRFDFR